MVAIWKRRSVNVPMRAYAGAREAFPRDDNDGLLLALERMRGSLYA